MFQPSAQCCALLEQSPFLELTSSNELYPAAPGEGLPLIRVTTPLCDAVISLQGAHLLEFKTRSGSPLLWLSPNCNFTDGNALRGGVPLCLPWFGVNRQDPSKPKHGFARNLMWGLSAAQISSTGECELHFVFSSQANELFDYAFTAEVVMTLGKSAKLQLNVTNTDSRPFDCSWALHSYHPVASLADVRVQGLAGQTYLDNLEAYAQKLQPSDVSFDGEVDRVFPASTNSLTIAGQPNIQLTHYNCPSVIVWNPGAKNAANIADIGAGQEQNYICVERGAVLAEEWNIPAGECMSGWLEIKEA